MSGYPSLVTAISLLGLAPYVSSDFDLATSELDVGESGATNFPGGRIAPWQFGTFSYSKDDDQVDFLVHLVTEKELWRPIVPSWEPVHEKLQDLRNLPAGWDTFGGPPIPDRTIENAAEVIDDISALGAEAEWIEPTSDGTIALQSRLDN